MPQYAFCRFSNWQKDTCKLQEIQQANVDLLLYVCMCTLSLLITLPTRPLRQRFAGNFPRRHRFRSKDLKERIILSINNVLPNKGYQLMDWICHVLEHMQNAVEIPQRFKASVSSRSSLRKVMTSPLASSGTNKLSSTKSRPLQTHDLNPCSVHKSYSTKFDLE